MTTPTYRRPGTYLAETLAPAPVLDTPVDLYNDIATAAFVGVNPRGPVEPTFIATWDDYVELFGTFGRTNTALPYAVYSFFNNGGRGCWALRAVGDGAVAASVTLPDASGAGAAPLLKVAAHNPGTWANVIYVSVTQSGAANSGRFTLNVYNGAPSPRGLVERHVDLSLDPTDRRYALAVVNEVSARIKLSLADGHNTALIGTATGMPALNAGAQLINGAAANPAPGDIFDAVKTLDVTERPLVINLPGITDTSELTDIIDWAEEHQDQFIVVDTPVGYDPDQAAAFAAQLPSSSFAAVYYPWVQVTDPAARNQTATRLIPPGGAVVGRYMATDGVRGVYKAPAGLENRIEAVATERKLTNEDLDNLNDSPVPINAIRQLPGAGVCIMGARTLKPGQADQYVNTRRSLIYIRRELLDLTQFALFAPNGAPLWAQIRSQCNRFLNDFWTAGGLRGAKPQTAYYVKCDGRNNKRADIEAGVVNIEVGVSLQYPAEFVVIQLGQFAGNVNNPTLRTR